MMNTAIQSRLDKLQTLTVAYAMGFDIPFPIFLSRPTDKDLEKWAKWNPKKRGLSYKELLEKYHIPKPKGLWELDHPNGGGRKKRT